MDRTLIQGIKRLRVLTPYDYDNMDELVQDLTTALEESSSSAHLAASAHHRQQHHHRRHRQPPCSLRSKWWGAKPQRPPQTQGAGPSVPLNAGPKSSAVSGDDSESSLDGGRTLSHRMLDLDAHQSDSDDLLQRLCAWRHRQTNAAESDSVNENFLPSSRPQRRKRKFKRMAVDLQPPTDDANVQVTKPVTDGTKVPVLKCEATEKVCGPPPAPTAPAGAVPASTTSLCGKRKRSVRERSLESMGRVHHRSECCDDMDLEDGAARPHGECSSSSLSSSESDAGILTNDEGREGDDEQSDFFHEGGPTCGVPPGVVAWWEEDAFGELDARFQAILAGSLLHMTPAARRAYRHAASREGREIRSGRRRLGKSGLAISLPATSELRSGACCSRAQGSLASGILMERGRACLGDIKRRRRTPPAGPVVQGVVGGAPLPESNTGNQMLRRMGWEPGTGLGLSGAGILQPLMAHIRPRHRGLGFLDPPPPPPPPSPQPTDSAATQSS